jgi:hypothetical protein
MRQYSELAQIVQSEGVDLEWVPRDTRPSVLSPDRAQRQHARLSAKDRLNCESVEARLLIRQPVPGTSIDPDRVDLILDDIERGPPEDAIFGESLLEDD